ncbi:MAG: OmpA family protein [Oscillospiraceae bacterium]|nr:OmpA family protein [Oscillospiraceae bacterium]
MARKKQPQPPAKTDGWLNTYADMVTLLLCFFVMMYTASVPDENRMQWILRSFASLSGDVVERVVVEPEEPQGEQDDNTGPDDPAREGETPGIPGTFPMTFDDLFNWVAEAISEADLTQDVSVEMNQGRMHIRFNDEIMFEPESYTLLPQGQAALATIAPGIRAINRFIANAEVAGHTAPAPPGVSSWGDMNHWRLSANRATAVTIYLDDELNMVSSEKFLPVGHGPFNPHYPTETVSSNDRNRRVELILSRNEYMPENTVAMLDMLEFDYLFPLITTGPHGNRRPCPTTIDRNQHIYQLIRERYGSALDQVFEVPEPTPGDGRGFDFAIPTIP